MATTEPRSASELVSLLLELARVVKARRYFEPGDARLGPLFEHARRIWVADLARYGRLDLLVQPDHIVQGGEIVAIDGRLELMLDEWRDRGVGRLSIEPDIDGDALAGLVEVLAMPESNLRAEGGAGPGLARRVPFGMRIEPSEADLADTDVIALRVPVSADVEPTAREARTESPKSVAPERNPPRVALSRHRNLELASNARPSDEGEVGASASSRGETGQPAQRVRGADVPVGEEPTRDPEVTHPSDPGSGREDKDQADEGRALASGLPSSGAAAVTPIGPDAGNEAQAPSSAAAPEMAAGISSTDRGESTQRANLPMLDRAARGPEEPKRNAEPAPASFESRAKGALQSRESASSHVPSADLAPAVEDPAASEKVDSEPSASIPPAAVGIENSASDLHDEEPARDEPSQAARLPGGASDPSAGGPELLDLDDPDKSAGGRPVQPPDDDEDTDVVALRAEPDPALAAGAVPPPVSPPDLDPPSGLSESGKLRWPKRMLKAAATRSRALADRARGAEDETADLADSGRTDADEATAPNFGKGLAGRLLAGLRSGSDTEPLPAEGRRGRGIADEDTLPVGDLPNDAESFLNPSDAAAAMLRELENASDAPTYAELTDALVRLVEAESTSLGTAATLRILSSLAMECDAKRGESERVAAETAIRRLAQGEVQDALFDQAGEGGGLGESAGRVLQKLGPDIVSPLLDYALSEPEPERFAQLAEHFGNLEASYTTTPVLAALGRSERQEVLRAIGLAERHPSLEATGRMADLLRSEDEFIREGAARALARRAAPDGGDDPQALRGLARGLQSTDPNLSVLCAECLSATGSPRAVPPLAASLHAAVEARDIDTARERIRALGDLGRGEAAGELASLLLTRDWLGRKRLRELKLAACHALGRLPGDEAVGVLSQAAQLRDSQLREAAQTALDRRTAGRSGE